MSATKLAGRQVTREAQSPLASGNHSSGDHSARDTQVRCVAGTLVPDAMADPKPITAARRATTSRDQVQREPRASAVAGTKLPQPKPSTKPSAPAAGAPSCSDHSRRDTQSSGVAAFRDDNQATRDAQTGCVVVSASFRLHFAAEFVTDIENIRIATENRLRQLATEAPGIDLRPYQLQAEALATIEHQSTLELQRAMRAHPCGDWVKATKGIGEKQAARLIAAIGDPYIKAAQFDRDTGELLEPERPRRGPAEIWAYCGYVPGQKRRKGVQANWNAQAKMRAHNCAEAALKAGVRKLDGCDDTDGYDLDHRVATTELGEVYLAARANWADRRDVSDGHKHNHGLRLIAKEILKSLFLYAKEQS